ncbi:CP family cyanate transporter-like MFS transporter [Microvirga flocculans]|uniref:CP family cyanate transporter-like MFS transporter n=1 Tax=Microvirga flocculans TaxID=217168 RepID=A0A7W6N833_9HYPH|nr:MFS transporter [Microvirga flocculans]MBB4040277.1 CP family cyanate transporter-like MFS transporter [Microvirga flocculans]
MPLLRDRETKRAQAERSGTHAGPLMALAIASVVLAAVNLRPALTSVATMIAEIQHGLGMSSVWMGALTTMPVLCFGVFGPLAPLLSARLGLERTLALLFIGLGAGLGLRLVPQGYTLFVSTLLVGATIGMAGVLLPVVIRRRFPDRIGPMTGLYTMVLSVGGASAAGLTPVLEGAWGSWTLALASWALPALAAAILWMLLATADAATTSSARLPRFSLLLTDRLAWYVTAFMGLQAGLAFIVLGWLPALLRDRGLDVVDAGAVTSLSIMAQTVTALLVPSLAAKRLSPQVLIVLVLSATCVGFLGLLYAPIAMRLFWALLLGLGQGGLFGLALLFVTLRSPTAEVTAMLSGMSQSIGYLGASLCPFAVGLLRGGQNPFVGPAIMIVAISMLSTWCGLKAAAPQVVLPHLKEH